MCTQLCHLFYDLLLFGCLWGSVVSRVGTPRGNTEVRACALHEIVIRDASAFLAVSTSVSPASSASRMPLDLRRQVPMAPGSGDVAAQCASQGAWSSARVFTISLLTLSLCLYLLVWGSEFYNGNNIFARSTWVIKKKNKKRFFQMQFLLIVPSFLIY